MIRTSSVRNLPAPNHFTAFSVITAILLEIKATKVWGLVWILQFSGSNSTGKNVQHRKQHTVITDGEFRNLVVRLGSEFTSEIFGSTVSYLTTSWSISLKRLYKQFFLTRRQIFIFLPFFRAFQVK